MSETCGDCEEPIWWEDRRNGWENKHGQAWCKGPDGTRPIWEQQHAPKGSFPVRVRKPEGQVCRCIAANREHIHRLEILPDGAELRAN
jgi:hypothetical protein